MSLIDIGGRPVLLVSADGPLLGTEQDALDLIGETYGTDVEVIAVPAARLHPDFLVLRTGMAGAFLQKMQNYGHRFAVVGDISSAIQESGALRDFVYESNKVGRMLFATDLEELAARV